MLTNTPKTKKEKEPATEYAIRCFIDGRRLKSSELTKKQATIFYKTALILATYLKREYKVN